MLDVNLIDPVAFAKSALLQEDSISLTQLDERVAQHEFLAHAVQGDDAELFALAPVVLVEAAQFSTHREVLLNLGLEMPQGFESFSKVVEVVSSFDEQDRALARGRWRSYQSAGHAIERFDLVLQGDR